MVKKVLTLALGLVLSFGAMADNYPYPASNIQFWTGSGSNSAVVVISWDDEDASYTPQGFAWGVRFNGTISARNLLDTIAAYDSRFTFTFSSSLLSTIAYHDNVNNIHLTPSIQYNCYYVNGSFAPDVYDNIFITNGDMMEVSESCMFDCTNITPATDPNPAPAPVDAEIAASDILFWVGHGENQVVLAVNWADSALAWGYRFSTDSVLVGDMVNDIAAADPRFSYEGSPAYISDFLYADSTMSDTLCLTPHDPMDYSIYFNMTVNHVASMLGAGMHKVVNGDFVKFADTYAAVKVDSTWVPEWGGYWDYTYAWPMAIHPVTVPDTTGNNPEPQPEHGPFCGAVGTEGCNAVSAESNAIVAWATGVVLTRGPQNITAPEGPAASFGGDTNAIGMATLDNTSDAVSLGDGGSALVTFAHPIRNGEGPDFAVFENGFSDNSLELAFVEVSTDGERFVRFPATCLTQTETQLPNAGQTDPTNLNNLAGKFRIGYGTPFDLEELRDSTGINIDSIVYVRIVDVVGNIDPQYGTYDAFGHIINDPWPTPFASSGFDLTGVAVMYELNGTTGIADAPMTVTGVYPNPATDRLTVAVSAPADAQLYDHTGRCLMTVTLRQGGNVIDLSSLHAGVYILRAGGEAVRVIKR